jgi:hypothetical protein
VKILRKETSAWVTGGIMDLAWHALQHSCGRASAVFLKFDTGICLLTTGEHTMLSQQCP